MQTFPEYISQRLEANGYQCKRETEFDLFAELGQDRIWICYLNFEITPEQIRRCFDFPGHVLFVVNEKLIPQEIKSRKETPLWLRVLHGLCMGRIYVWNGRYLFGLHFDYDTGDINESGIIQPDDLLLTETGTWLRGWTGVYRLARFYDRRWWDEPAGQYERAKRQQSSEDFKQNYYNNWTADDQKQSNARQEYEQARDRYQQAQREREQAQYQYRWHDDGLGDKPPKQSSSDKRDFMREFAQAGSSSAVKALFRKLAREFHPDLTGRDTNEEMAAINAAYERWK